jgi:hypothetical protein
MMSVRTLVISLFGAAATVAVMTGLTVPLARETGLEFDTVSGAERVIGFTLSTVVILVVVHTPVLFVMARVVGSKLGWISVSAGGVVIMYLAFMLPTALGTGSLMPLAWNVQGWIDRPIEFAADWLPFFAGAAVFGALVWSRFLRSTPSSATAV